MKFLTTEYKAVRSLIEASRLKYEDFTFVKKRGKLHMLYKGEVQLAFYRKTETRLNEQRQWERLTTFTVYRGKDAETFKSWNDVLKAFEEAIRKLADAAA